MIWIKLVIKLKKQSFNIYENQYESWHLIHWSRGFAVTLYQAISC